MINFLFKNQKILFDCFCLPCAFQNPIEKTNHFIPEWWKNLPKTLTTVTEHGVNIEQATMKTCVGVVDLFKSGFILPLWSDLNIKVQDNYLSYIFASSDTNDICGISSHPKTQYGSEFDELIHFKITTPWIISEKTGIKVVGVSPQWNILNKFPKMNIVHGMFEYGSQKSTNINGFFQKDIKPYQYNIEAGTPMLHFIPLTEKEIILKNHVVSETEFKHIKSKYVPNKFIGWGLNSRNNFQKKRDKCPFSFK